VSLLQRGRAQRKHGEELGRSEVRLQQHPALIIAETLPAA